MWWNSESKPRDNHVLIVAPRDAAPDARGNLVLLRRKDHEAAAARGHLGGQIAFTATELTEGGEVEIATLAKKAAG